MASADRRGSWARAAARAAAPSWRHPVGLPPALVSLRHPNYRLLWFGTVVSNSGDWMDQAASFGVQPAMAFMAGTLVVMARFGAYAARSTDLLDDDNADIALAQ